MKENLISVGLRNSQSKTKVSWVMQDVRKLGGLIRYIPWTYTMNLIGSLSLLAFPFLTGYYSKEIILDVAFKNTVNNLIITKNWSYWVGTMTVILTTIYTMTTIKRVFLGKPRVSSRKLINKIEESKIKMSIPLIMLSISSIWIGYILKEIIIIEYSYEMIGSNKGVYIPTIISIMMIIITIMSPNALSKKLRIKLSEEMGNINNNIIIKGVLMISMIIIKNVDQGMINPFRIKKIVKKTPKKVIQIYAYKIIVAIIIILIIID